jgi:ABC-type branched-subunit amino acid transport system substrate-binding protein
MKPMDTTERRFTPAWSTLALVLGLALALASLAVQPGKPASVQVIERGAAGDAGTGSGSVSDLAGGSGSAAAGPAGTKSGGGSTPGVVTKAGLACAAGRNGGSTDVGVSGSSIKLGATVVESGIGASFLGDVRFAMNAVKDKVNRAGGVCGRQIDLKLVDDGWDYQRGGDFIRNLVEGEKVFALSVVPSSEGLKNVSDAGYLKSHQVPVVGTDGMLINQYRDPYIWPVAASTISTMHVMVKQAYDTGVRRFAIVYESTYHFGIEGAYAFNAAVKRLTGADVPGYSDPLKNPKCDQRFCGITAGASSYQGNIQQFNDACGGSSQNDGCQYIALLLEPTTATNWMKGGAIHPSDTRPMGGPQPLFTYDFGNSCGAPCDSLQLWTGYYPPIGDNLSKPAVATYVNDIKAASSTADFNNSFVEGGYVGMELVVKALQAVGPNLTRANLKATLDNMDFDSGLAPPLHFRAGNHYANSRLQAFSMQFKGGFNGWRDDQLALSDPWYDQDSGH